MEFNEILATESRRVALLLKTASAKLVLAESCTAGLVAASLGTVPGISEWLCGSMVVYQTTSKAAWLGIDEKILRVPGPVSEEVTVALAESILEKTAHATMSAAVTGHLGPDAPAELDGVVFLAVKCGKLPPVLRRLVLPPDPALSPVENRRLRQIEATIELMKLIARELTGHQEAGLPSH